MSDQNETPQEENIVTSPEQEAAPVAPQDPSPEEMVAALKDQLLRQMAETENLRKRAERERDETARYAVTKLARDLLDVADNLGRALSAIEAEQETLTPSVQTFVEGVKMTQSALESTFERYKIQKINPKGEAFDHNFHQAMFEVPTNDQVPGTVVEVLQPGYVLHDRLLRPAMVGVSKALDTTM